MIPASKVKTAFAAMTALLLLAGLAALCIGRYSLSLREVLAALASPLGAAANESAAMIVLNVRLPRVILALLVGAGLSTAGCAFQAVFGNPLASPDIIGVSSGSAFGAAAAILLFSSAAATQLSALLCGLAAVAAAFSLSSRKGKTNVLMLVLAGVVVAAFFNALVSCAKYVADPESELPEITFWLMGSLNGANYLKILLAAPFIAGGMAGLFLIRWRLNILPLPEDEIEALGMNAKRIRWVVILLATAVTAASVSACGEIGWVGLMIPHAARAVFGPDNTRVVPASALMGGAFLVAVDTVCRTASAAEIPLSILTALIGAPMFAWLFFGRGGAYGSN